MSYTETHSLTFEKLALRNLQDKVVENNHHALVASLLTQTLSTRGWLIQPDTAKGEDGKFWTRTEALPGDDFKYRFRRFATVTFTREDGKKPEHNELASLIRTIGKRSSGPAFGEWKLVEVDGETYTVTDDEDVSSNINVDMVGYVEVELPEDFESYFKHLFGRDSHIARIKGALEAAIMSDWTNRFNCALIGPPGCGKSDICATIKRALGDDAVMEFDATATTGAGAIKELGEREILPRVLIVEEIEKADEKALAFLLGVMDMRAEIRKTTAKATIQRDTKLMVIATVNNVERFKSLNAGALASRFSNKIGFSRPSREQLAMILTREVGKLDDMGDERWIKPTLDYCEDHGITDPRQVISLCLCGREGWLDGSYAAMLEETNMENMEEFS